MAEPFLSEIRIFSFYFAPQGWALCNGAVLPINQNQALYSLLGTAYGGNGVTSFALPDLRGRAQMHMGSANTQGLAVGTPVETITLQTMPTHLHMLNGTTQTGDTAPLANAVPATIGATIYSNSVSSQVPFHASSVANAGGSQPHENRQPYLVLNFCIALQGIFPSQN